MTGSYGSHSHDAPPDGMHLAVLASIHRLRDASHTYLQNPSHLPASQMNRQLPPHVPAGDTVVVVVGGAVVTLVVTVVVGAGVVAGGTVVVVEVVGAVVVPSSSQSVV